MRVDHRNRKGYSSIWLLAIALMFPSVGRTQTQDPGYWVEKSPKQTIFNVNGASYHNAIAQRYRQEANRLDSDSRIYADMGEGYRNALTLQKEQHLMSRQIASICEGLAARFHKEARERHDLADIHEDIAKFLKQQGLPVEGDPPRQEKWVD